MSRVTVTADGASTDPIVWTGMSAWSPSPITTHVTIPGAVGGGYNFRKGVDNCTATLSGMVPWTSAGEEVFERVCRSRLSISTGNSTRYATVTNASVDQNQAWIIFTLTVTED